MQYGRSTKEHIDYVHIYMYILYMYQLMQCRHHSLSQFIMLCFTYNISTAVQNQDNMHGAAACQEQC